MACILVSVQINLETTSKVDDFPTPYFSVRYPFHGSKSSVSGFGYYIDKALTTLGDDIFADQVRSALAVESIVDANVLDLTDETAQSVILFDPDGCR